MILAARRSQGETDMPDVLAEVRKGWVASRGVQFLDAIHAAIVETLHTPEDDKVLRLVEHPPEHFAIPGSASERYTHIEITMFAGRTLAAKRALYKAIVRNLEPFGVPANDVKIILIEVSPGSVGMRGGVAACDLDIGYEIRV
jgi:phenylpyruvate tautomerase PptA (4-oxalocrotonate tautomerase family)